MSLIPKWFIRKRGLASGLVLAGIGLGGMVLAPFVQVIINYAGWRFAFIVLAAIMFFLVAPVTAILQRRPPRHLERCAEGYFPNSHGISEDGENTTFSKPWNVKNASQTKAFWFIVLASFCNGFMMNMLIVHQAAHVVDAGYSQIKAATSVGLVGLFGGVGGILFGFVSDRFSREISYTIGGGAASIGILHFLFIQETLSHWMLFDFVIFYGLGHGSMVTIIAAKIADLFPGKYLGKIVGIVSTGFGVGSCLGAYSGGYYYDTYGSYFIPFVLVLISIIVAVIGIWMASLTPKT
jgi:MFS family permease